MTYPIRISCFWQSFKVTECQSWCRILQQKSTGIIPSFMVPENPRFWSYHVNVPMFHITQIWRGDNLQQILERDILWAYFLGDIFQGLVSMSRCFSHHPTNSWGYHFQQIFPAGLVMFLTNPQVSGHPNPPVRKNTSISVEKSSSMDSSLYIIPLFMIFMEVD